jgi:hypothetical protein
MPVKGSLSSPPIASAKSSGWSTSYWQYLSLLTLLTLLVLAAIFWRERAWFIDVAYQTVLMIKDGSTQVQVMRFGAAIVQLLPLLAIKLELPLAWVSALYSVSFPLLYLLFWALIVGVFRQWAWGLALALLYTTMTYDGFYWCTSELQQGLGFLLVLGAGLCRYPQLDHPLQWVLLVLALIALVFYHPLVFIPFCFLWAWLGWSVPAFRHWRYGALLILMFCLVWAKGQWFPNYYDTAKLKVFTDNLRTHFPNYFSFPAYAKFFRHSLYYWWGFPLLLGVVSIALVYLRRWFGLVMIWGACVGFVVLNALGSPNASYRFYSEVNYYPLVIFVAVPACLLLEAHWAQHRGIMLAGAAFLLLRLGLIYTHHQPYTARWQYLEQLLHTQQAQQGGNRFLAQEQQVAMDTLIMSWGTPFETLLLSTTSGDRQSATLLVTPDSGKYTASRQQADSLFLMEFRPLRLQELERNYFKLGPGTYQDYQVPPDYAPQ